MFKRIGIFLLTNMLVMAMVSIILSVVMPRNTSGVMQLAIFCGVFGMVGAFISLAISRKMAKWSYGIKPIDPRQASGLELEVYDMVAQLAKQAGLPNTPEVGIYSDADPNAFATGPTKSRSLVAFSTGLLENMDSEQVRAVAAHEISHIANGDMVTMTLLTGVVNSLVMFLSRIIAWGIDQALRGDDEEGEGLGFFAHMMVVWVLDMVFMFLASIPLAWFSRYREYKADAGGARLTSNNAMASALERLGQLMHPQKGTMFDTAKISSKTRFSIFSSHPPLEERVARLRG